MNSKSRATMIQSGLPSLFWGEVILHAEHKSIGRLSPHEELLGVMPNIDYLRISGSAAYEYVPKEVRKSKCIVLSRTRGSYKVREISTGKFD